MLDIYWCLVCIIFERMVSFWFIINKNCIDIFIYIKVIIVNWLIGLFVGMVVIGYKLCN